MTIVHRTLEAVGEFFCDLVMIAAVNHAMETIENDLGVIARVTALDPESGIAFAAVIGPGQHVRVNRSFRVIVEPFELMRTYDIAETARRWTQT